MTWYFDCLKDYTPSSKVSFCGSFEPGFTKKALETLVFQGPKRSRDLAKKKSKEKSMTLETMVGIERPRYDF
jgi:hypothetical protein